MTKINKVFVIKYKEEYNEYQHPVRRLSSKLLHQLNTFLHLKEIFVLINFVSHEKKANVKVYQVRNFDRLHFI